MGYGILVLGGALNPVGGLGSVFMNATTVAVALAEHSLGLRVIQGGGAFEVTHGLGVIWRFAQAIVIVQAHVIMERGFISVFGRAGVRRGRLYPGRQRQHQHDAYFFKVHLPLLWTNVHRESKSCWMIGKWQLCTRQLRCGWLHGTVRP